jgi:hypothetical protein
MQTKHSMAVGTALLAMLACAEVSAESNQDIPSEQPAIRLESVITGDKEQPAVSYFIPWQGTKTPEKLQWNIEDKHDGTIQPVDRAVMQRSMNIYNEMNLENN